MFYDAINSEIDSSPRGLLKIKGMIKWINFDYNEHSVSVHSYLFAGEALIRATADCFQQLKNSRATSPFASRALYAALKSAHLGNDHNWK